MAKKVKPIDVRIIAGKFEVQEKLGSGCFGEVYRGKNTENHETVAIKLESKSADLPQLKLESDLLNILNPADSSKNDPEAAIGFAFCYFYGPQDAYNCLVMPLMSASLEDCMKKCDGKFSFKTTLVISEQALMRIEYLHSKGYLHRDIKPENFMWGSGAKQNVLHLIDFGLSKRYYLGRKHIPFKNGCSLTGTARYASIPAHEGHEQGRRDDLEAIGHMLVYFLTGTLPWTGLDAKTKLEKYERIKVSKQNTPLAELCAGYPAYQRYLEITRCLAFAEKPDYLDLRELFQEAFAKANFELDYDFEWFPENGKPENLVEIPTWYPPLQPEEMKGGMSSCCSLM